MHRARIQAVLDRLFVSNYQIFHHKLGATICMARRAGTTAILDNLNKYMFDANMIAVGSSYWNMVFERTADEATLDDEGLQTINNLALNIVYVLKCQESGKSLSIKKSILDYTKNKKVLTEDCNNMILLIADTADIDSKILSQQEEVNMIVDRVNTIVKENASTP